MWILIPALFSSVLAQLFVELQYDEMDLTKKKEKKNLRSDLIFTFFYPSEFPDRIHSAAVRRTMLAVLAGKSAAV